MSQDDDEKEYAENVFRMSQEANVLRMSQEHEENVLLMSQDVEEVYEENDATMNVATSSSRVVADEEPDGRAIWKEIFGSDSDGDESDNDDDALTRCHKILAKLAESCCQNTAVLIDGLRLYLIAIKCFNLSWANQNKKLKMMCKLYSPIDASNLHSEKFLSFHYLNGQFGTRSSTAQVVATLRTRQRHSRLPEKNISLYLRAIVDWHGVKAT